MKSLLRKTISQAGFELVRKPKPKPKPKPKSPSRNEIAFLHIGKNAGTQIVFLTSQIEARTGVSIRKCGHKTKLLQIDPSVPYFFSVRNPISRFKSAFYSRKRKGQPRTYSEWTEAEAFAFADFEHANELAENLFSAGKNGAKALMAVQSISHTSMHQIDWFVRVGYFLQSRPPLWIIRQEKFNADMAEFLSRANLGMTLADIEVSNDPKTAHKNDYTATPELSERAIENLMLWYSRDFEFYKVCESWIIEHTQ
jgi:hypothetical protein